MKRYLIAVLITIGTMTAFAGMCQDKTPLPAEGPQITFDQSTMDFGDIVLGDSIQYVFRFTNTGSQPLQIQNVVTTCSCTSREYTTDAVAPGGAGFVKVTFNSGNQEKTGRHNKVVTILSNAVNNPERVILSCNVLPAR
jgi:hypothetical protein